MSREDLVSKEEKVTLLNEFKGRLLEQERYLKDFGDFDSFDENDEFTVSFKQLNIINKYVIELIDEHQEDILLTLEPGSAYPIRVHTKHFLKPQEAKDKIDDELRDAGIGFDYLPDPKNPHGSPKLTYFLCPEPKSKLIEGSEEVLAQENHKINGTEKTVRTNVYRTDLSNNDGKPQLNDNKMVAATTILGFYEEKQNELITSTESKEDKGTITTTDGTPLSSTAASYLKMIQDGEKLARTVNDVHHTTISRPYISFRKKSNKSCYKIVSYSQRSEIKNGPDLGHFINKLGVSNSDPSPQMKNTILGDIVFILSQVLSQLKKFHGHGLIHRDLKLMNFLLFPNNIVKLCDFSGVIRKDAQPEDNLGTFVQFSYQRIVTTYKKNRINQQTFAEFITSKKRESNKFVIDHLENELKFKKNPRNSQPIDDLEILNEIVGFKDEKSEDRGSIADDQFSLGIIITQFHNFLTKARRYFKEDSKAYVSLLATLEQIANTKDPKAPGHLLSVDPEHRMTAEQALAHLHRYVTRNWQQLDFSDDDKCEDDEIRKTRQTAIQHFAQECPSFDSAQVIYALDDIDQYFSQQKTDTVTDETYKDWFNFLFRLNEALKNKEFTNENYATSIAKYLQPSINYFQESKPDYAKKLNTLQQLFAQSSASAIKLSLTEFTKLQPDISHRFQCYQAQRKLARHVKLIVRDFALSKSQNDRKMPHRSPVTTTAFADYQQVWHNYQKLRAQDNALPAIGLTHPTTTTQAFHLLTDLTNIYNSQIKGSDRLSPVELTNLVRNLLHSPIHEDKTNSAEDKTAVSYYRSRSKPYKFDLSKLEPEITMTTQEKEKKQPSQDQKQVQPPSFIAKLINDVEKHFAQRRAVNDVGKDYLEAHAHWQQVCRWLSQSAKNSNWDAPSLTKLIATAPTYLYFFNSRYAHHLRALSEYKETSFIQIPIQVNQYLERKIKPIEIFREAYIYFQQRLHEENGIIPAYGERYTRDLKQKSQDYLYLLATVKNIIDHQESKKEKIKLAIGQAINQASGRYRTVLKHLQADFDRLDPVDLTPGSDLAGYLKETIAAHQDFYLTPFQEIDDYLARREASTGSGFFRSSYGEKDYAERIHTYLLILQDLEKNIGKLSKEDIATDLRKQVARFRSYFGSQQFADKLSALADQFAAGRVFNEPYLQNYLKTQISYYQKLSPLTLINAVNQVEACLLADDQHKEWQKSWERIIITWAPAPPDSKEKKSAYPYEIIYQERANLDRHTPFYRVLNNLILALDYKLQAETNSGDNQSAETKEKQNFTKYLRLKAACQQAKQAIIDFFSSTVDKNEHGDIIVNAKQLEALRPLINACRQKYNDYLTYQNKNGLKNVGEPITANDYLCDPNGHGLLAQALKYADSRSPMEDHKKAALLLWQRLRLLEPPSQKSILHEAEEDEKKLGGPPGNITTGLVEKPSDDDIQQAPEAEDKLHHQEIKATSNPLNELFNKAVSNYKQKYANQSQSCFSFFKQPNIELIKKLERFGQYYLTRKFSDADYPDELKHQLIVLAAEVKGREPELSTDLTTCLAYCPSHSSPNLSKKQ